MLVGQSRYNKLHWHALIDGYLLCQREIMARISSIKDYDSRTFMCQRCEIKLDRLNPDWRKQANPENIKDVISRLRITKS